MVAMSFAHKWRRPNDDRGAGANRRRTKQIKSRCGRILNVAPTQPYYHHHHHRIMHQPLGSSRSAAFVLLLACLGVPSADGFVPGATTSGCGSQIIDQNNHFAASNHESHSHSSSQLNAFLGRYMVDIGSSSEIKSPRPSTMTGYDSASIQQQIGNDNDVSAYPSPSLSRRKALGQAATAAMVTAATASAGASPAFAEAYTQEPTTIQLKVETDYLIKSIEAFNGDMRRVLAAIVRSPYTEVSINAPQKDKDAARDAILRALYSYEAPEDYLEQARWLEIGETDSSLAGWLTRKRWKVSVPNFSPGEEMPLKTTVTLSNLEAGVGVGILSYPLTYGYYKYEGYWEEQEAKARKEAAAAKKAAAAKAKAKKDKAKPAKEGGAKASGNAPKKAKAPLAKNNGREAAKAKPASAAVAATATEGATAAAAVTAASIGSTQDKSEPQGPPPNADAVWQKLQLELAKDNPQVPVPISPPAVASDGIPQPAAEATVTAPAVSTPSYAAGGMSTYESYLAQAYATTPAPVPVTPVDPGAATYTPPETAVVPTLVEEEVEPMARSAQPLPKMGRQSPFGGGYLDSLSPSLSS